ncbi:MAG: P-II family nitrogen regulator [Candidatus Lokiarchaeota archaeon]|nr:P-II family nitrogen regulator [Candidatus Lokiarchaeota archaeon]
MKKIECFIRPEKLEPVKEGLFEKGIKGITLHNVKGHGSQRGIKLVGRTGEYCIEWIDKLKLEIVVSDKVNVQEIVDIIVEKAQTGQPGDGKIFITPVEDAIRIRTKECGEDCL